METKQKDTFKKMVENLNLEIFILNDTQKYYGLKWGEGVIAKTLGFKQKDLTKALD